MQINDECVAAEFFARRQWIPLAQARAAAFYAKKYGFALTPDQINCDGCKSKGDRRLSYCEICRVRECGTARGLDTCAACPDQPCDKLEAFHAFSPDAEASFDAVVASGEATPGE